MCLKTLVSCYACGFHAPIKDSDDCSRALKVILKMFNQLNHKRNSSFEYSNNYYNLS